MADELYAVRNQFWIGNYQQAINEGSKLNRLPESSRNELRELTYRSFIAMGQYDIVLREIQDDARSSTGLKAIRLLALWFSSATSREAVLAAISQLSKDGANDTTLRLMSALIYLNEDRCSDAIRCLVPATSIELSALLLQCCLKMNRLDLAITQLRAMQAMDEDSTLSHLSSIYTLLFTGGQVAVHSAQFELQELIDRLGPSSTLSTLLACCHVSIGEYHDAEGDLNRALAMNSSNHGTILVNLYHTSLYTDTDDNKRNRIIGQLSEEHWMTRAMKAAGEVISSNSS